MGATTLFVGGSWIRFAPYHTGPEFSTPRHAEKPRDAEGCHRAFGARRTDGDSLLRVSLHPGVLRVRPVPGRSVNHLDGELTHYREETWVDLHPEFVYRVRTTGPLPSTSGSPHGERQYWVVSEAELTGDRIRAGLAAPGNDWMWVSDNGFWRPHVRVPFTTEDGATVLMH